MQGMTGTDLMLESRIAEGTVLQVDGKAGCLVEMPDGPVVCRKAAGCLLDPGEGDLVLVSLPAGDEGRCWILSVLERASVEEPATVTLHEGVMLAASKGRLSLYSEKETILQAQGRLSLSADTMDLSAGTANWFIRSLSMVGGRIESVWEKARQTVASMQTVCSTWVQHLGDSVRHVSEVDETHADNVRILAKDTLQTQGKFVNQTASEVVKIDGREVHLG